MTTKVNVSVPAEFDKDKIEEILLSFENEAWELFHKRNSLDYLEGEIEDKVIEELEINEDDYEVVDATVDFLKADDEGNIYNNICWSGCEDKFKNDVLEISFRIEK